MKKLAGLLFRCLGLVGWWVLGILVIAWVVTVLDITDEDVEDTVRLISTIAWSILFFGVLVILAVYHSSREDRIREEERIRADERRRIWEEERRMYNNNLPPTRPTPDQNVPPIIPNTDNTDHH